MRLLAIADTDDIHWKNGPIYADVLVSCGDVVDEVILETSEACGCKHVLAVKGNHDRNLSFPAPVIDLHLETCEYDGVTFGGFNGCWKYKPHGHFLYEQEEVEDFLSTFPPVDVFVGHNSPRGIHDIDDFVHYGFDGVTSYIHRTGPKILLHGHQHVNAETAVGDTRVIGVYGYKMVDL